MTKQVLKIEATDFAQVISCLGFITSIIGETLPAGQQKTLCTTMGNDLIDLLLKYSTEEKQQGLKSILADATAEVLTEGADTSVSN